MSNVTMMIQPLQPHFPYSVDKEGFIILNQSKHRFHPGLEFAKAEDGETLLPLPKLNSSGRVILLKNKYASYKVPATLEESSTAVGLTVYVDGSSSVTSMLDQINAMREEIYGMFKGLKVRPAIFVRFIFFTSGFKGDFCVVMDYKPFDVAVAIAEKEQVWKDDFLAPMKRRARQDSRDADTVYADDGDLIVAGGTPENYARLMGYESDVHFAAWVRSIGKQAIFGTAVVTDGENTDSVVNATLVEMRTVATAIPVGEGALMIKHTSRIYYCASDDPDYGKGEEGPFSTYCKETGADARKLQPHEIPADMREFFVSASQLPSAAQSQQIRPGTAKADANTADEDDE